MWHMLEQYPESRLGRLCKVILVVLLVQHRCCCCCFCTKWIIVVFVAASASLLLDQPQWKHQQCHWGLSLRRSPTVRSLPFATTTPLRIMSKFSFLDPFFFSKSIFTEQVLFWPSAPLVQHGAQFLPHGKTPCDRRDSCANFQRRPRLLGYNPIKVSPYPS